MKLKKLAELPECKVSRPSLGQRLTVGINQPEGNRWLSVEHCVTTPVIVGRPNDPNNKATRTKKESFRDQELNSFVAILNLIKPCSERHNALVIQSRNFL